MIPKHIAVILDGNRRYSKKKGISSFQGHYKGAQKVEDLINWAIEFHIRELTLYSFSLENFQRSKKEVDYLFDLFRRNIKKIGNNKGVHKNRIRINFIGRLNMFPKDLRDSMIDLMNKTKRYDNLKVNFAMAYGSIGEIVDMVKNIIKKKYKKVDEKIVLDNLYLKDSPDLLIRPGGEKRLSNFLLIQMAYTELYFTEKLWPEFKKKDFTKAIREFEIRERRYGK